jgi:predicted O-methyltransferase YrrM
MVKPDITKALAIQGWTSEKELLWLAEQAQSRNRIVEIGCWKGRSTRALADNTKGFVYAVDTWKGTKEDGHYTELKGKPEDWLFMEFFRNVRDITPFNIALVEMPSMNASSFLRGDGPFDMIFIDAAHDYDNVKADILAWRPLLNLGGLICGHDFDGGRPGVVKAVRELFTQIGRGPGSIWVGESW